MRNPFTSLARYSASKRGAKVVLVIWLLAIVLLSALAPSANPFSTNSGNGSINGDKPSEAAERVLQTKFPSEDGMPALLVLHGETPVTAEVSEKLAAFSAWLSSGDKPAGVAGAVPFHRLPPAARDAMFSADRQTLLLQVSLAKGLDGESAQPVLDAIRDHAAQAGLGGWQLEITGPAGVAADSVALFKNADLVLILATAGLILVLLLAIYRAPLSALLPLGVSGFVYAVVDRVLGMAGRAGWFQLDKQAMSIMMILLFAVLTDYCLFVFSRYRESLKTIESKYDAMSEAVRHVAEPIVFSGGTVLAAMLSLFAAVFKSYHAFAPVFSIAMVLILLAGLTLIPAVFALTGRRAFWPFVPKLQESAAEPSGLWMWIGAFVTRKPVVTAVSLLVVLGLLAANASQIRYSFNLMKSFPADLSSRRGFEQLEASFPQGRLAPVTVLLASDAAMAPGAELDARLSRLQDALGKVDGVDSVTTDGVLSADGKAVRLQLILRDHPYDVRALDTLRTLREDGERLLRESGAEPGRDALYFGGETAAQLDVRAMNERDTLLICALVTLLIAVMLTWQTRSLRLAALMVGTILLSYFATLGLGEFIFRWVFGLEAISYRIPLYAFVFLVALGVDYNIMMVSRIREEATAGRAWREAVKRGVAWTGGVISSAGLILGATFGVLMTQPLQELLLFGLTMTLGILIDTFLVRGMLLPALMTWLSGRERRA